MTNILIMLLLLTGPWIALALVRSSSSRLPQRLPSSRDAAAWGTALLFAYTATGHFVRTEQLAAMLPPSVPARASIVYLTGVLELLIAIGLLHRPTRRMAAWAAVVVLMAFSPANIYAAVHRLPFSGNAWGPIYLMARIPVQVFIIFWIFRWILRRRHRNTGQPTRSPSPDMKG